MEKSSQNEIRANRRLSERWASSIGLIIVFGSEFMLRDVFLPEQASDIYIGIAVAVEWLILLGLITIWIPKVEGKKLESIGLTSFKRRYLWLGILAYFAVVVAMMISGFILESAGLKPIRSLQPILKGYSFIILFSLFLTGTFLEEIFYRGYLIERSTSLTGQRWVSAATSWLAYTLVHLKFFGLGPTIDVSILSAVLVLLYLKERSIWPCIIVHGINDAFGFLIFPLFITL